MTCPHCTTHDERRKRDWAYKQRESIKQREAKAAREAMAKKRAESDPLCRRFA